MVQCLERLPACMQEFLEILEEAAFSVDGGEEESGKEEATLWELRYSVKKSGETNGL